MQSGFIFINIHFLCILVAFFTYIKHPILMKIILRLTQDKITMMLLNWRAYQISMWFATDHAYYKITKSHGPVGFLPNLYITERKRQAFLREKLTRFSVSPVFRPWNIFPIFSTPVQCFCSLSTASAQPQSLSSYFCSCKVSHCFKISHILFENF